MESDKPCDNCFVTVFLIIFIFICFFIICAPGVNKIFDVNKALENFAEINILDTKSDNKIYLVFKRMLMDIDAVFRTYHMTYWLSGKTLLWAHKGGKTDYATIALDARDRTKLHNLKNVFNNLGYDIIKIWSGYRLSPHYGRHMKYMDRTWYLDELNRNLDDVEYHNHHYPFIDIHIFRLFGEQFTHLNKMTDRVYKDHYDLDKLLPLKRVIIDGMKLNIPNKSQDLINCKEKLYYDNWEMSS